MGISSAGIGSGLDVAKIVSQMVDLEKSPLKGLQAKADGINTQISTYGEIKSLTSKLGDIVSKLSRDGAWSGVNISSSNSTLSGAMTGIATPGSYHIKVNQLAQAQTVQVGTPTTGTDGKPTVTSLPKDTVMGGTGGHIELTVGGKQLPNIEVTPTDTLTKIAAKINAASSGVQASVVTDVDGGERLMLRSKESGKSNQFDFKIVSNDSSDGSIISSLAAPEATLIAQQAQNAQVTLNGVMVESATNTFANSLPGMSFSVTEVTAQTATLTVKADTDGIKKSIQEFVDAYNNLNDLLSKSTKSARGIDGKLDPKVSADGTGVLQGDSGTVSLQNALRSLARGFSGSSGSLRNLSDIGIQMQLGGKLTVDDSKLTKGLTKLDDLKALFANKADASGQGGGIAVNFKSFTDKLLAFDGTLNTKTDALDKRLKGNQDEQDKVNARADTLQTRLYKQYSALDGQMASLNALNSYVSQMVTSWNKSKG